MYGLISLGEFVTLKHVDHSRFSSIFKPKEYYVRHVWALHLHFIDQLLRKILFGVLCVVPLSHKVGLSLERLGSQKHVAILWLAHFDQELLNLSWSKDISDVIASNELSDNSI